MSKPTHAREADSGNHANERNGKEGIDVEKPANEDANGKYDEAKNEICSQQELEQTEAGASTRTIFASLSLFFFSHADLSHTTNSTTERKWYSTRPKVATKTFINLTFGRYFVGSFHRRLLRRNSPSANCLHSPDSLEIAFSIKASTRALRAQSRLPAAVAVCGMEYRGKQYSVVRGLDTMWKWSVPALVGQTKSGKAECHADGVKAAQRAIDKSLAPKKRRLRRGNERDA